VGAVLRCECRCLVRGWYMFWSLFISQWNDTARDRYVDDILLVFYSNHTNIQTILDDFNAVHPSLNFTAEMETNSTINYLDVTIHKTPTGWRTSIYRKPTFTDTIIPYTSIHTTQHKYAAIKFYTTDWTHTTYLERITTKKKTLYTISCTTTLTWSTRKLRKHLETTQTASQKWTTFTYTGKEITFIINIFRWANYKIAFRTNNSI